MQDPKKASNFRKVALRLLIAGYFLVPITTGWLSKDRVDCASCLGDMLHHHFAIFGYIVAGVYLVSITQPRRGKDGDQVRPNIAFQEDLQFTGVLVGLGLSTSLFVVNFNWNLFSL